MNKYLSTHAAVVLEVITHYSAEEETSLKPKVCLCADGNFRLRWNGRDGELIP